MVMDPETNKHTQRERSRHRTAERESAKETERPEPHKVGIQSVVDAVRDVEFPKTFDDIVNQAGDRTVRTSEDTSFPLGTVLNRVREKVNANDPVEDGNRFPSLQDYQTTVQRHWAAIEWMEVPEEQRPAPGGSRSQTHGRPPSEQ